MAVKYLRLFDPTQQFQLKGGQLNVAGRLYVHFEATDDLADLYDENGTQLTQPVILDNNGRAAGLFVDSSKVYWLDVQDQFGMSQFTIRKMTPCGGGGGATLGTTYELLSSDGSIAIDKTTEGNVTTYDLTRPDDSTELLEWIRCDGATKNSDTYTPIYADGTMEVGVKGIKVYADRYYHVTAHLRASKSSVQPYYDKVDVLFRLVDDNDVETNVIRQSVIVDSSVGLVQDFEVSTDVKVEEDAELLLDILNTTVPGITWEVLNLEAHRVFSGAPVVPGGVANKPWVEDNFQPTLTAGDNITIVNNVISATAAPQEQSDWTETDTTDVSYIKHKPSTKPVVAGENITITEGTNSFVISANANSHVQADWDENDSSDPSYIQHKPNLSVYATESELTSGLATKQDTISDLATIRSGAAAGATAIQPSDLATVATTGNYDDLTDKPDLSIYAESSNLATVATTGSYDDLVDKPTIPAAQVNSDWTSNSGVSQILNKPTLSTVATTGDYNDLVNKPSIPAAQVNADWNSTSGVSEILNKPSLAAVATSGDYSDLSNTPTIPTATSDLTNDSNFITLADVPAQVQADWTESDTADPSYIAHKPTLAAVATSGDYSDLSNTPTINNVPAVTSNDDNKVLKASYTGGVGSYSWETETAGTVTDVTVDGSSVVSNGVAAITMPTVDQTYDSTSANAQSGVAMAGALSGKQDNMVVLDYGVSTWNDFITAYNKNAVVYCRYEVNSTQFRLAHLAFVNNSSDVTKKNAEFWFSRSIGTHTAAQQGDQIIVYKLQANGNVWTTATREIVLSAQAGDGITRTVTTAEGAGTIEWSVKPAANGGITVDANGVSVTNPIPDVTSSDDSKVLKATYSGGVGSYAWETESGGGTTYTAGDGIDITAGEISAKAGAGIEIADVSESTTYNLVCAAMSSRYESGRWAQDICPMTQALADAMNTSDGFTFTLAKTFDTYQMYIWPCIAKTSELLHDELQNYAFFGNYLSCRPSTDGSDHTYEVPAGTTLTLKFSERDQLSTVTVADILADLSSYSLVLLWYDEDSPYAAETMLSTAMTPETTATYTTTTSIQDAICVSNPLPASTPSDADKILTVNAQGAAAWGMRIQQVAALPANPDANTLYLIPEA